MRDRPADVRHRGTDWAANRLIQGQGPGDPTQTHEGDKKT
jgi:hypothetical protein